MTCNRKSSGTPLLTADDLARLPDDGRRYELADGRLEIFDASTLAHSLATSRLLYSLTSSLS